MSAKPMQHAAEPHGSKSGLASQSSGTWPAADETGIEAKAAQLALYKQRYYQGQPTVPDAVYDALEEELRRLAPNHPVLTAVGFEPKEAKVPHTPPMLSLLKTYDAADCEAFIRAHGQVCLSDKLDGMALALEYDAAGVLVRASSRGNGSVGENVTAHAFLIPAIPKLLRSPPGLLGLRVEIRGEVFFPLPAFAGFSERFDSFRNAVPGTLGRKDPAEAADVLAVLSFCAYDVMAWEPTATEPLGAEALARALTMERPSHFAKLAALEGMGFWAGVADGKTALVQAGELGKLAPESSFAQWLSSRITEARPYAIDGLVLRCDDDGSYATLGATSHHPRGSLAFKQEGETAVTSITSIHMGVGRSGKISFRAELDPVFLSGARLAFATLHNAEFIETGGYAPGARVRIKRSGEVIPYIIGLETPPAHPYELPVSCLCGSALSRQGPDLFCLDNAECPYRDSESLLYFVKSLEIYGVSDKILDKLRSSGLVTSPPDLFGITVDDLLTLEGFGPKLAQNVIEAIAARRQLSLATFLTSLGLKRGGKVKCAQVAQAFGTLDGILNVQVQDLAALEGWAEKSAADFLNSLHAKRPLINELRQLIAISDVQVKPQSASSGFLSGKHICITGTLLQPRKLYEDRLRDAGATLQSSVTAQTDFLVCNEPSASSKYRKALELGVKTLTEAELETVLRGAQTL